jgi:hypothetical protein
MDSPLTLVLSRGGERKRKRGGEGINPFDKLRVSGNDLRQNPSLISPSTTLRAGSLRKGDAIIWSILTVLLRE